MKEILYMPQTSQYIFFSSSGFQPFVLVNQHCHLQSSWIRTVKLSYRKKKSEKKFHNILSKFTIFFVQIIQPKV